MTVNDGGGVTFTQPRRILWRQLIVSIGFVLFSGYAAYEWGGIRNGWEGIDFSRLLMPVIAGVVCLFNMIRTLYYFTQPPAYFCFSRGGLVYSRHSLRPIPWESLHIGWTYTSHLYFIKQQSRFLLYLHKGTAHEIRIRCNIADFLGMWNEVVPVMVEYAEQYGATIDVKLKEYLIDEYDLDTKESPAEKVEVVTQKASVREYGYKKHYKTNYRSSSVNAEALEYGRKRVR
ncbi:hypothetical protein [Kordiimonas laminariae]|uniref:hypothetical protein n=1 Tax=Kordiimonas laminariae TaxID=2917717 RepID=UPI001FF53BEE|nr:hypothetical protein [Kordiimonas laminariae]MCK0068173.1 hypothetical protein [Kordiimonas laminariae]